MGKPDQESAAAAGAGFRSGASARRRRVEMGKPDQESAAAAGAGFRSGASATWCCVYCAGKISSRCRGSWGSRRRGPRSGVTGFWPRARPA